jgi:spore coat polysaccharide biosynthesis predicted glycosyltransferase SpsG
MAAPPPVEVRSAAAPSPPQAISAAGPTLVERPAVDVPAAEVIAASPQKIPETFIELLDASLGLRV